uniref:Uncharacterized protein n=1 Tax=Arundo donax TaxID=35708 RepID=A0A0A9GT19_ARUDO
MRGMFGFCAQLCLWRTGALPRKQGIYTLCMVRRRACLYPSRNHVCCHFSILLSFFGLLTSVIHKHVPLIYFLL